jgi:hypothetical protein
MPEKYDKNSDDIRPKRVERSIIASFRNSPLYIEIGDPGFNLRSLWDPDIS